MMAVLFPFEVPIYTKANVPVRFTGHPMIAEVQPSMTPQQALKRFELDGSRRVIGLLPGSRESEIKRLMPIVVDTANILLARFPDLQFLLPVAPSLTRGHLTPWLANQRLSIKLVEHHTYDVIQLCDAIITASGTATLQVALLERPMAIIYKVSPLTYWVARLLVTSKHVGMVNILLDGRVAQEFIQYDAQPEQIANEISRLLTDKAYAQWMRDRFSTVKQKLVCAEQTDIAKVANEMLVTTT